MKKIQFMMVGMILVVAVAGSAFAQVRETPATISMAEGGNPRGYVQGANDQGVIFSTSSGGRGSLIPYAQIRGEGLNKMVRMDARPEELAEPRALFESGDYSAAAEAFGAVARNYSIILNLPQNFAAEALFYQCESLLRAGKYAQLARVLDSPAAKTIETKLGDYYKKPHEYQKLWAFLGKKNMEGLRAALAAYQQPMISDAKLLPTPNFTDLPSSEVAQLAYLRGKLHEADGEKKNALDDYYRAFTLAYGNNELMSKLAMGAVMVILKDDPQLKAENKAAMAEMQSVAYLFSKRFGSEGMPEDFKKFAVRPAVVRPVVAEDAEMPVDDAPVAEEGATDPEKDEAKRGD
jgi:tetratricopeptide (TPR) repeat protein